MGGGERTEYKAFMAVCSTRDVFPPPLILPSWINWNFLLNFPLRGPLKFHVQLFRQFQCREMTWARDLPAIGPVLHSMDFHRMWTQYFWKLFEISRDGISSGTAYRQHLVGISPVCNADLTLGFTLYRRKDVIFFSVFAAFSPTDVDVGDNDCYTGKKEGQNLHW